MNRIDMSKNRIDMSKVVRKYDKYLKCKIAKGVVPEALL
jgi:hypothetical protein